MFVSLLMLICALLLSTIAGFYSVIGMTAIFAASFIPVLLMTGGLEAAKVITASWLYNNWRKTPILLRSYLTAAVVVLMFITSLGIFGFLSKAHIEQTGAAKEGAAKLQIIDAEIARQKDLVSRSETTIRDAENKGTNSDANIQSQIDKEQARIDSVNTRIQPAIDEQNQIIAKEEQRLGGGVGLLEEQVRQIDADLAKLDQYLTENNIRMAQGLVGAPVDGKLGNKSSQLIGEYRDAKTKTKNRLVKQISDARGKLSSPIIDAAREEIKRLRSGAEQEIANSTALIAKLRSQLGAAASTVDVGAVVTAESSKIEAATAKINKLTEEKYDLEATARKLEVEVGPIKYVAQLIYGDDITQNLLEKAVRYIIILIIAVFDPLAVLMLIAANQGLNEWRSALAERWARRREDRKQAEAEAIVQPVASFREPEPDNEPTEPSKAEQQPSNGAIEALAAVVAGLADELRRNRDGFPTGTAQPTNEETKSDHPSAAIPDDPEASRDCYIGLTRAVHDDEPEIPDVPPPPMQTEDDQEPVPVREPVREDVIDDPSSIAAQAPPPVRPDRIEWQIIDQLPEPQPPSAIEEVQDTVTEPEQMPEASQNPDLPSTTDELFDALGQRRDGVLRDRSSA